MGNPVTGSFQKEDEEKGSEVTSRKATKTGMAYLQRLPQPPYRVSPDAFRPTDAV